MKSITDLKRESLWEKVPAYRLTRGCMTTQSEILPCGTVGKVWIGRRFVIFRPIMNMQSYPDWHSRQVRWDSRESVLFPLVIEEDPPPPVPLQPEPPSPPVPLQPEPPSLPEQLELF